jgi:hypothetical protein
VHFTAPRLRHVARRSRHSGSTLLTVIALQPMPASHHTALDETLRALPQTSFAPL